MTSSKKVEDLDLTQDELSRLTKALKNEEFRKLLAEYAEEISDPENRAKYEEEIAMLENERGMDVKFVHPNPGHVIKTALSSGNTKAFFNICKNEHIEEAKCSRQGGKSGLQWSIPHSFAPVRDDVDKKGNKCKVFDFVVHPNTYRMAETNDRFMKMIHDTALESAEKQFGLQFDKKQIQKPKMKFKGAPTATVVRSKIDGDLTKKVDPDDFLNKIPFPYDDKTSEEKAKIMAEQVSKEKGKKKDENKKTQVTDDGYETPLFTIKHRSNLDLQNFTNARDSRLSTRPTELVVEIDLPLLESATSVDLDIFEKELVLKSNTPAKYKLNVTLPYEVDENEGSAKFEKGKHKLLVTLPVVPQKIISHPIGDHDKFKDDVVNDHLHENEQSSLIEVLSSDELLNREGMEFDSVHDDLEVENAQIKPDEQLNLPETTEEPMMVDEPRIFYTCPPFSYHQDDETVTIIFNVKNVARSSVVKKFLHTEEKCTGIEMKVVSVGPGGFPMHYSFLAQFPGIIDEEGSFVNLNDENVVVTIVKVDECLGMWEKFEGGLDSDNTKEMFFLTEHNIKAKLDLLDRELDHDTEALNKDELLDLEVTDMNSKCLSVDIKEKQGSGHSFSESAEEIEVVHDQNRPKIQGILKQRSRTMSESSDDIFAGGSLGRQYSTGGETSPTTVTEESENEYSDSQNGERKKSVSFCEHVDQTLYKATQSVSSMRSTIKNKRKKAQRKEKKQAGKERRQEQRRRRNSNSLSEPSSDECISSNVVNVSEHSKDFQSGQDLKLETNGVNSYGNHMDDTAKSKQFEGINDDDTCDSSNKSAAESAEKESSDKSTDSDDGEEELSTSGVKIEEVKENKEEIEKPDTILSWEEKGLLENGHSPPSCAFDFSNNLMYELDVD